MWVLDFNNDGNLDLFGANWRGDMKVDNNYSADKSRDTDEVILWINRNAEEH